MVMFLAFAAGLLFASIRVQERRLRVFLLCGAALNLAAFANA
jgi:hypothetical protein